MCTRTRALFPSYTTLQFPACWPKLARHTEALQCTPFDELEQIARATILRGSSFFEVNELGRADDRYISTERFAAAECEGSLVQVALLGFSFLIDYYMFLGVFTFFLVVVLHSPRHASPLPRPGSRLALFPHWPQPPVRWRRVHEAHGRQSRCVRAKFARGLCMWSYFNTFSAGVEKKQKPHALHS